MAIEDPIDFDKCLVWVRDDGGVSITIPTASAVTWDDVVSSLPTGTTYHIVALADIPTDRTQREAWVLDEAGSISVDPSRVQPTLKTPQVIATAKLSIADGSIEGFAADSAVSGGFALDVGKFLMFFGTPQPDTDYIVNVFDGGLYRCYVQPDDYATDSFVVTTTDLAGAPADPACISIIIMRAI